MNILTKTTDTIQKGVDMKFLKSISLFCLILALLGVGGFIIYSYDKSYESGPMETKSSMETESQEVDLSVSTKQNVTTCDTVYEVEAYVGNEYMHSVESIPFSFTGLNREELLDEIERYEMSPTFADKQNGFVSIELISFHPEKIVVKKVYEKEQEKIIYYLKAVDHKLVVYRSDIEEIYMPTDLTLDMLPENVQQEVINTKCFNDISEVYDFLESYTS